MPLEKQRSFEDSSLWKLKVRLQFSGWLQYIIHAMAMLIMFIISGIGFLLSYFIGSFEIVLFWLPFCFAVFLLISLFGTIAIVKYGIHPNEKLPKNKNDLDVFDLMRYRRSCRSFQATNLTTEHHTTIMESVAKHSAKESLLGDKTVRFEYIKAPLTVWPVVGAHEFLVAIAPKEYDRMSIIDVGRSLQKIILDATRQGIATCWIGPGADQHSIVSHLGDKFNDNNDHVICVCAIGYNSMFKPFMIRAQNLFTHKRLPLNELFFSDEKCTKSLDTQSLPYSEYGRCYEVCQWSPSSFNGQTTRCAAISKTEKNVQRFDFFASTKSKFYAPVALGIWCANWEVGCNALGKKGSFEVFPIVDCDSDTKKLLPNYDISWVVYKK